MAKKKPQKEKDLAELVLKLKAAKSVVLTDYRGTTVKDIDKFRKTLSKEGVFSKVYKLSLLKKAAKEAGVTGEIADHKTPVILSISNDDETTPARVIQNLSKDIKTIGVLEGLLNNEIVSKAQVEAMGSLPSKDQLRAQFMSVLNGPMAAFARAINALAEKSREAGSGFAGKETSAPAPVAEPVAA